MIRRLTGCIAAAAIVLAISTFDDLSTTRADTGSDIPDAVPLLPDQIPDHRLQFERASLSDGTSCFREIVPELSGAKTAHKNRRDFSDYRQPFLPSPVADPTNLAKQDLELLEQARQLASASRNVYTVTDPSWTLDSDLSDMVYDPPTLPSALQNANYSGSAATIVVDPTISIIVNNSGNTVSASVPITLDGARGDGSRLVIDGANTSNIGLFCSAGNSMLKNLEIRNFTFAGIAVNGYNSVVQGCDIHNNVGPGINCNNCNYAVFGGTGDGEANIIHDNTGSGAWGVSLILNSGNNLVIGNYIGTTDGMTAAPNDRAGVEIDESQANRIVSNVIVGNRYPGISKECCDTTSYTSIVSNFIGYSPISDDTIPNLDAGIDIQRSKRDTIRDNVIAGNQQNGITFYSNNSVIKDNIIGTNPSFTKALGNGYHGISGGGIEWDISGNTVCDELAGISISVKNAQVTGNRLGVWDQNSSDLQLGNTYGIYSYGDSCTIGGIAAADRNIVSGNSSVGIGLNGFMSSGTVVRNNFVGFDQTGTLAFPNSGWGIAVTNGGTGDIIRDNTIAGPVGGNVGGITVSETNGRVPEGNKITGNHVGTNSAGSNVLGAGLYGIRLYRAEGTKVGGAYNSDGNVIAGYDKAGINVYGGNLNDIYGNVIGMELPTKSSLSAPTVGDQHYGIFADSTTENLFGATGPDSGNVIGFNDSAGVAIVDTFSNTNLVYGNFIGTSTDSTTAIPNYAGILIDDAHTNFLADVVERANLISQNTGPGVWVRGEHAYGNMIRFNKVFNNGGLDIDLGDLGVTANDLGDLVTGLDDDAGPNDLLNFPAGVSYEFDLDSVYTIISGFLDSYDPELDSIDIYATPERNSSHFGGAREFIATVLPDTNGYFHYIFRGIPEDLPYTFVSATATDPDGSTSEFSYVCGDPLGVNAIDNEEDGLCDSWEDEGIDYDGDGNIDLALNAPPLNANDRVKDIYVEVDWMKDNTVDMKPVSLLDVDIAFQDAPVDNPHSSIDGIELHPLLSDSIPPATYVRFFDDQPENPGVPFSTDFHELKWGNPVMPCGGGANHGWFGDDADRASGNCAAIIGAKRLVYRYCIFGENHSHEPGSSGIAELPGNDFMVTLGGWDDSSIFAGGGVPRLMPAMPNYADELRRARGRVEDGTFMHELGHTLGLMHGGDDDINYKPQYLSVMNYAYQTRNIVIGRALDYSREKLLTLDESALDENLGLNGVGDREAAYLQVRNPGAADDHIQVVPANIMPIDWNGIDSDMDGNSYNDNPVSENINGIDPADPTTTGLQVLSGFDDWSNLRLNFRNSEGFAAGGAGPIGDLPADVAVEQAKMTDYDGDGINNFDDNCPAVANPDQADANGNGIGDVCESTGFACGDIDGTGDVNISDAVYMVNYIFAAGPAPLDERGGDIDCSGDVNISDAVYLVNYIFAGGPAPCAACK